MLKNFFKGKKGDSKAQKDDQVVDPAKEYEARKKGQAASGQAGNGNSAQGGVDIDQMLSQMDTSKLSRMQKMGLKMFQKLPKSKQEEVLKKAMSPDEVKKHQKDIEKHIDELVESGQIDKSQVAAVKSRLGLK
jgi:hypothetical protein